MSQRTWKPPVLAILVSLLGLVGIFLILYPSAAGWVSQYNQSKVVSNYDSQVVVAHPSANEQWLQAHRYNQQLTSGALLESNENKPTGDGTADTVGSASLNYDDLLKVDDSGLMGRVKIPSISVDLPIYHGTSDETLQTGIGHLEGTSLPVGGKGTRSVLTGHRGLATSKLFTDLNKVDTSDTFTLEILDQVLTYKVREVKVVEPDQTQELRAQPDQDLVTLVTCTPLGINSQRILVTGERITPTPIADIKSAGTQSELPGFPWWLVISLAAIAVAVIWVWRSGKLVRHTQDSGK